MHNTLQLTHGLMLVGIVIWRSADGVIGNMRGVGSSWVNFRRVLKRGLWWHVKAIWRLGVEDLGNERLNLLRC